MTAHWPVKKTLVCLCPLLFSGGLLAEARGGLITVASGFAASELLTGIPRPYGLSTDNAGNLFAGFDGPLNGDVSAQSIRRIPLATPGSWASLGSAIPDPDTVFFDGAGAFGSPGTVLVGGIATLASGRISQVAADGTTTTLLNGNGLANVNQMAVNSANLLFVANSRTHEGVTTPNNVLTVSSSGVNVFATFNFTTQGAPSGIAMDAADNVYVALGVQRIAKLSAAGTLINLDFVTGVNAIQLALDTSASAAFGGFLYATESGTPGSDNGKVWRIDPATGAKTVFAQGFSQATGITISSQGSMFVSDAGLNRIIQIDSAVPEPSSWTIFVLGALVAICAATRTRLRRARRS